MPLFWGSPNIEKMKTKGDIEGLIKALDHKNEEIAQAAASALGELGADQAVEPLIRILSGWWRQELQSSAVTALGQIGGGRAFEALIPFLKPTPGGELLQQNIITAMVRIGDPRAVVELSFRINDDSKANQLSVIQALTHFGDAATPILVAELVNPYKDVRNESIKALKLSGWQPNDEREQVFEAIATDDWKKVVNLGAAAVEPLATILYRGWVGSRERENEELRGQSLAALGEIGSQSAIRAVVEAFYRIGRNEPIMSAVEQLLIQVDSDVYMEALISAYAEQKLESSKAHELLMKINPHWADTEAAHQAIPTSLRLWLSGQNKIPDLLVDVVAAREFGRGKEEGQNKIPDLLVDIDPPGVNSEYVEQILPECIAVLNRTSEGNLEAAAAILIWIGKAQTIEPLVKALLEHESHSLIKELRRFLQAIIAGKSRVTCAGAVGPFVNALITRSDTAKSHSHAEYKINAANSVIDMIANLIKVGGATISQEDLEKIVNLKQLQQLEYSFEGSEVQDEDQYGRYTYTAGTWIPTGSSKKIDTTTIEQLARQELIRRSEQA
jgi:hypothetical protein